MNFHRINNQYLKRALLVSFFLTPMAQAEEILSPKNAVPQYNRDDQIRFETAIGSLHKQVTEAGSNSLVSKKTDSKKKQSQKKDDDFSIDSAREELAQDFADAQDEMTTWKKEHFDLIEKWKLEHAQYIDRIPEYKKNLEAFDFSKTSSKNESSPSGSTGDLIVPYSFSPPIKDQKNRGTCGAFAAVRAVEILLAQNRVTADLSEQFFYYITRPDCQRAKCIKQGSWVESGLKAAGNSPINYLKTEAKCPYNPQPINGNATQIPLAPSCMGKGEVGTKEFSGAKGLAGLYRAFENGSPAIIATRLSENFYKTNGLVLLQDAKSTGKKLDAHAPGHAIVAFGYLALPEKLHYREGKRCILVANSWSEGWGAGGYGCVSERWFEKYGFVDHSLAVTKLALNTK